MFHINCPQYKQPSQLTILTTINPVICLPSDKTITSLPNNFWLLLHPPFQPSQGMLHPPSQSYPSLQSAASAPLPKPPERCLRPPLRSCKRRDSPGCRVLGKVAQDGRWRLSLGKSETTGTSHGLYGARHLLGEAHHHVLLLLPLLHTDEVYEQRGKREGFLCLPPLHKWL